MSEEEETPLSGDIENDEVLEEQIENAEISSEEEGFLKGYNEDIVPDKSDEEGLEDDEKIED